MDLGLLQLLLLLLLLVVAWQQRYVIQFVNKLVTVKCVGRHLLPSPRDTEITSRLRKATTYPRPRNRTNCYKSFIHHALLKYQ